MTPVSALIFYLLIAIIFMSILWCISLIQRKADIVDLGWSLCLGGSGIFYAIFADGDMNRRIILAIFSGLWGARLAWHLYTDRVIKPEEDGRYIKLRESWGKAANRNFYLFFLVQGMLAVILSFPFLVSAYNQTRFSAGMIFLSSFIFICSIAGEALADSQLKQFRHNSSNRGKTCRDGLWRFSRHPNYFFEWLHWFTYAGLAWGSPFWIASLINPVIMYYLITKVTGIPPTEERAIQSRGQDYIDYQQTTNAFFPWTPKS